MEQATRICAHIERILLVCGEQNAGKSRLIRHMFEDDRLGGSALAKGGPIPPRALSRDRRIAARITSPHEMKEDTADFHKKIDDASKAAWKADYRRINYVSAIQPRIAHHMPGIVDVCADLKSAFNPERIRVVQLSPDYAELMTSQLSTIEIDGLRKLDVEVVSIDARAGYKPADPGNIRILADFFDFS